MNAVVATVPAQVLYRCGVAGPRYTSYPTADRFSPSFDAAHYARALAQRKGGMAVPLSLYVHIPFCASLCYYCACNKVVTTRADRAPEYVRYLAREVNLHTAVLGTGQPIGQLHLGGGSPTFLGDADLRGLMAVLQQNFAFLPGGEHCMEVDPRTVSVSRLDTLVELGFNHLSFGVQDFDPVVQRAVNRVQEPEQVFALVAAARAQGLQSINVDLIYGLPLQREATFAHTLERLLELRPDRIALYAYTHAPRRFSAQRRIAAADLPDAHERVALLTMAVDAFTQAGYVYVGMDHFALAGDALAVAKRQGRLHRSFQGYTVYPDGDLIGLGVSAISRMGATYSQNASNLRAYYSALDANHFAVAKGVQLARDDLVRRAVIMGLLCQGEVQFESINLAYLLDFAQYFASELHTLQELVAQDLVTIDEVGIRITPQGWFCAHVVAMVFDRSLQPRRIL
jgi:oxygen-independent coproporphyrinogen III oxidase